MKLKIKVEDLFGTDTYEVDGVLKVADDSPRKITVINMGDKS